MALTTTQLADAIEQAMVATSQQPGLDPVAARKQYSIALAAAITAFVVGRTTVVVGSSATGGPVTATGTIS